MCIYIHYLFAFLCTDCILISYKYICAHVYIKSLHSSELPNFSVFKYNLRLLESAQHLF